MKETWITRTKLNRVGADAGINERTVNRAKKDIGTRSIRKPRIAGTGYWKAMNIFRSL